MKLYLVRHGESDSTGIDNERSLSDQGRSDIQRLATFISPLKLQVLRILHSEKRRAQQTAEILASCMDSTEPMEICFELSPLASVIPVVKKIYSGNSDVVVVGHMPFMGKLVAKLVTNNENQNIVSFAPGCMVCLEQIEQEQWSISWMLNPGLFKSTRDF
jgi:phosphohistidine phosphatase